MKELCKQQNKLKERVEILRLKTRTKCYEDVTDESLPDFPRLTLEELRELTLGVYQVIELYYLLLYYIIF